jgi:hypothetical protein
MARVAALDLVRGRGSEHLAGTGSVEHASTHEPAVHRFMTAAASGQDGDFALHRRVCADHVSRFQADMQQIRVRRGHPHQKLAAQVAGIVDQLFHGLPPPA